MSLGRRPARKGRARSAATVVVVVLALLLVSAVTYLAWRLVTSYTGGLAHNRGNVTVVPEVEGASQADAEALLKAARLRPLEPILENHDSVPKGNVFRQDPAPGERVRPGRSIKLYVSLGPARFVVPDLSGQQLDGVPAVLSRAGLILGTVTKLYDPAGVDGQVVNQNPAPGTEFGSSAAVDLYVTASSDLPEISMPHLVGMQLQEAETLLANPDVNLHLSSVQYIANDAVAPGTVVAQNIDPDKPTKLGSTVDLQVGIPAALMQLETRRLTIALTVPQGPPQQDVKIKVYDKLGSKIDYEGTHSPGDLLQRSIDLEGPATVSIFVSDMDEPYREERL